MRVITPNVFTCEKCGHRNVRQKNTYKTTKMGARPDLGNYVFHSGWEANVARYLNLLKEQGKIESWDYEVKRFDFPITKGVKSYLPDFLINKNDFSHEWWEVKGYWTARAKTAITRFKKYYPKENIRLIERKEYKEIEKEFKEVIPNWE